MIIIAIVRLRGKHASEKLRIDRDTSAKEKQRATKGIAHLAAKLSRSCKLTWLLLGGDPAARSHRVEQGLNGEIRHEGNKLNISNALSLSLYVNGMALHVAIFEPLLSRRLV